MDTTTKRLQTDAYSSSLEMILMAKLETSFLKYCLESVSGFIDCDCWQSLESLLLCKLYEKNPKLCNYCKKIVRNVSALNMITTVNISTFKVKKILLYMFILFQQQYDISYTFFDSLLQVKSKEDKERQSNKQTSQDDEETENIWKNMEVIDDDSTEPSSKGKHKSADNKTNKKPAKRRKTGKKQCI